MGRGDDNRGVRFHGNLQRPARPALDGEFHCLPTVPNVMPLCLHPGNLALASFMILPSRSSTVSTDSAMPFSPRSTSKK